MATYTQLLSAAFGKGFANLLASVRYSVVDAGGTTRIAATNTGITEAADADATASTTGLYRVTATLDDTWTFPLRVFWGIVGQAGIVAEEIIQSPPEAVNASGQTKVQSGTGAGQISLTNGVASVNVTQFGGAAGTFASGRPQVTVNGFTATGDTATQSNVATAMGDYDTGNGVAIARNQTTILNRLGGITGTGVNTVLGYFKALLSKTATNPSDIGGTFDPTTDSTEAIRDSALAAGAAMTLTSGERDAIATAILDLANGVESGETLRQFLRLMRAVLVEKDAQISGDATAGVIEFRRKDGSTAALTVTYSNGVRSSAVVGTV